MLPAAATAIVTLAGEINVRFMSGESGELPFSGVVMPVSLVAYTLYVADMVVVGLPAAPPFCCTRTGKDAVGA